MRPSVALRHTAPCQACRAVTSRSLSLASPAPAATSTTTPPPSSSTSTPAADRRLPTLLALLAVYVVWGSTYLVMRIAVETLPPMLMGAIRFTIAGGVLLAWAGARGAAWPTARQWLGALPVGALLFVGGNGFVAIAEKEVSSGLAAVVCATMPLWMAIFASVTGERPSHSRRLGDGGRAARRGDPVRVAAGVGARLAAVAPARPRPRPHGRGQPAARRRPGAGGGRPRPRRAPAAGLGGHFDTVWTVAYLIVFGSLIAFSAYAWLLRNTRPAVATSYAFVNPALAVLLGVVLGAEQVGVATVIATPLIIAAVVLVVGRKR